MNVRARLVAVNFAGDVRRIRLNLDGPFPFHAGQYLFIVHRSGRRIPFSIASSPHLLPSIELHFRPLPGNEEATLVNEILAGGDVIDLDGPHGEVMVTAACEAPLVLIAGGTGIAQARSIVEFLTIREQGAMVLLLWSVARREELYCDSELVAFTDRPWFRYVPLIDMPGDAANAAVRYVERQGRTLPAAGRVLLCGGAGFVRSVTAALLKRGIARERLQADMYSFGVA